MAQSIKDQFVNGAKWNAIGTYGHYFVSFFISIILSRLLSPEEFGMIAMLTVFIEIAREFINSGFVIALVQKQNCSEDDYSTVFYFNVFAGVLLYVLLYMAAPYIASFYNMPQLTSITRYLGVVFVIGSLGLVQTSILLRDLDFRRKNVIALASVVVSAIISIMMAYMGYGVYSLVAMNLSYELTSTALLWVTSKWFPKARFSSDSFRTLFGFGSKILVANMIKRLFFHIDSLLVGKIFSASVLGFYSKAKTTKDLAVTNTVGILSSSLFPIFTKIKEEDRLEEVMLKTWNMTAYVVTPIMVGLILVSEPLIEILFSSKWLPSVPWMQILCVGGLASPLAEILSQVINSRGRSDIYLKVEVYKKIVGLVAMLFGLYMGIKPFLWMLVVSGYINLLIEWYYTSLVVRLHKIRYLFDLMPTFGVSLIMGVCVFFVGRLPMSSCMLKLLAMASCGVIVYIALSSLLRLPEYVYLKHIVIEKMNITRCQND